MSKICFCTLAVGHRYRAHAKLLAADIQKYSASIPLVILTDRPAEFVGFPRVIAHKHHLQSVLGYHDKLDVLKSAIAVFDTCIFVDADIRILGNIPSNIEFSQGLTGRFGCSILKHNKYTKIRPALPLIEKSAQALGLNLDSVVWLHECFFTLRRQQGIEQDFFRYWNMLACYFQSNKIYNGEGNIMGLAAAATGLKTQFKREDSFPFFKDVIEKEHIKQGKSFLNLDSPLFRTHRQIEYPHRALPTKALQRLQQQLSFYYRQSKMHHSATQNAEFRALSAAIANGLLYSAQGLQNI